MKLLSLRLIFMTSSNLAIATYFYMRFWGDSNSYLFSAAEIFTRLAIWACLLKEIGYINGKK